MSAEYVEVAACRHTNTNCKNFLYKRLDCRQIYLLTLNSIMAIRFSYSTMIEIDYHVSIENLKLQRRPPTDHITSQKLIFIFLKEVLIISKKIYFHLSRESFRYDHLLVSPLLINQFLSFLRNCMLIILKKPIFIFQT